MKDIILYHSLSKPQLALGVGIMGTASFLGISKAIPWILPRMHFKAPRFGLSRGPGIEISGHRISDESRKRHTHIIGATGSGKSVLIENLLFQDLRRGYGALVIDAKGDRSFYEMVKKYCKALGRESDLHYLSSTYESESVRWNPCRIGNLSELQSKFYCAARYDHPHYAKAAELVFLQAFEKVLGNYADTSDQVFTLTELVTALDEVTRGGRDEQFQGVYLDMKNLTQGEWAGVLGLREKVGIQAEVSILDLTRKNQILFVDLPTEGKAVQSSRIGALLLQELTLISGLRKRMPMIRSERPFSVFVDEFDAFATEPFVTFLNKGRSSDFMIHIAHQTLSDLKKISPSFEGQILGNPNVRFIFRVDLPEDAERIAKFFGTKLSIKRTWQTKDSASTGMGSIREVQEFRVHPDAVKELSVGKCVLSIKTEGITEVIQVLDPKNIMKNIAPLPVNRGELKSRSFVETVKAKPPEPKPFKFKSFTESEGTR